MSMDWAELYCLQSPPKSSDWNIKWPKCLWPKADDKIAFKADEALQGHILCSSIHARPVDSMVYTVPH